MKIATWNINGVRARIDTALAWVKEAAPDILCFQEIKCEDAAFPSEMFEELGYNVATHGQKGFNGVAILSKLPLEDVSQGLAGDDSDTHSRFIEAVVSLPNAALRVVSLYLPNGNPVDSDKFPYKLAWMERLAAYARARLADEEAFLLAGDFNVIVEPIDARFPENWTRDALYQPETRAAWRRLVNLGLTDAFRACAPEGGPLFLLGLSGRRLAEEQRHPHRPHPAVAAGRRPPRRGVDREAHARLGQAVRPCAGGGRPRFRRDMIAWVAIRSGCATLPHAQAASHRNGRIRGPRSAGTCRAERHRLPLSLPGQILRPGRDGVHPRRRPLAAGALRHEPQQQLVDLPDDQERLPDGADEPGTAAALAGPHGGRGQAGAVLALVIEHGISAAGRSR